MRIHFNRWLVGISHRNDPNGSNKKRTYPNHFEETSREAFRRRCGHTRAPGSRASRREPNKWTIALGGLLGFPAVGTSSCFFFLTCLSLLSSQESQVCWEQMARGKERTVHFGSFRHSLSTKIPLSFHFPDPPLLAPTFLRIFWAKSFAPTEAEALQSCGSSLALLLCFACGAALQLWLERLGTKL